MMKRNLLKTLFAGGLLPVSLLVACDVHEFPIPVEPEKRQVVLNLSFDTDMPVHQVVDVRTRASIDPQDYDMRYTVCIYRADADGTFGRVEDVRTVVAKDDVTDPDNSIGIELEDGDYRFIAWADYVDAGTLDHKFFNTDDFAEIALLTDSYSGGTEFRDAFHGTADATVSAGTASIRIALNCRKEELPLATELLCDILSAPRFPAKAVERERTAILEELKVKLHSPESLAEDLLESTLFAGHPYGIPLETRIRHIAARKPSELGSVYRSLCLNAEKTVFDAVTVALAKLRE